MDDPYDTKQSHILQLPLEIIGCIFMFIAKQYNDSTRKYFSTICAVCSQFKEVFLSHCKPLFWKLTHIRESDDLILRRVYEWVRNLRIYNVSSFSLQILDQMTNLEKLYISDIPVDDEYIYPLTNLRKLTIDSCPHMSGVALHALTKLEKLELVNVKLQEHEFPPNLTNLIIRGNFEYSSVYFINQSKLTSLTVCNAPVLGDDLQYMTQLQTLKLIGDVDCTIINDRKLTQLSKLVLNHISTGGESLNGYIHLTNLKLLGMSFIGSLPDDHAATLTNIQRLSMREYYMSIDYLRKLPKLEYLKVYSTNIVEFDGPIASACEYMDNLNIKTLNYFDDVYQRTSDKHYHKISEC